MKTKILILFIGIIIGVIGIVALQNIPRDYSYTLPEELRNAAQKENFPTDVLLKNVRARTLGPISLIVPAKNNLDVIALIGMSKKPTYPLYYVFDHNKNKIPDWFGISDKKTNMCDLKDKNEDGIFDFMNIGNAEMTINFSLYDTDLDGKFDTNIVFIEPREEISIRFKDLWYKIIQRDNVLEIQKTHDIDKKDGIKIFYAKEKPTFNQ